MIDRVVDQLGMLSLRGTLAAVGRGGVDSSVVMSRGEVGVEEARLRGAPAGLCRPVVILNGYHTPPQVAWWARLQVCRLTSQKAADFLTVSYLAETQIGRAAEKVIAAVEERWPSGSADGTIEVDVVGISMGGLVARLAASRLGDGGRARRLRVANLYTFATPHRGSLRAALIAPDAAARDMKPNSRFLADLNAAERGYKVVSYIQRRDNLISVEAAAPPGESAIVGSGSRMMSHFTALHNPWFLVDLARRLRSEPALLRPPGGGR